MQKNQIGQSLNGAAACCRHKSNLHLFETAALALPVASQPANKPLVAEFVAAITAGVRAGHGTQSAADGAAGSRPLSTADLRHSSSILGRRATSPAISIAHLSPGCFAAASVGCCLSAAAAAFNMIESFRTPAVVPANSLVAHALTRGTTSHSWATSESSLARRFVARETGVASFGGAEESLTSQLSPVPVPINLACQAIIFKLAGFIDATLLTQLRQPTTKAVPTRAMPTSTAITTATAIKSRLLTKL